MNLILRRIVSTYSRCHGLPTMSRLHRCNRFGEKGLALAQWSFLLDSPQVAHIYGTKGEIDMERTHCPERLRVTYSSGEQKVRALLGAPPG